jgi:hypothetical protein
VVNGRQIKPLPCCCCCRSTLLFGRFLKATVTRSSPRNQWPSVVA